MRGPQEEQSGDDALLRLSRSTAALWAIAEYLYGQREWDDRPFPPSRSNIER
jgi:hypothetical protein